MSSRSSISWLGITDPQTKFLVNLSHDFQARIFECLHAIRVEKKCLQLDTHQCLRPASLISSSHLSFNFSHCATCEIRIVGSLVEVLTAKHLPREMIVRSKFGRLPSVVGSNRLCSLRHAANGFFRELATMSLASLFVAAMSAVSTCCTTNSRFCTSHISLYGQIRKNLRSMSSVLISVTCPGDHAIILPLLRPPMKMFLLAHELLRTTETSHVNET